MKKDRKIAQRAIKWAMRALYGIGFAVVYYLLFSLFFDTPIEHELKQSTKRLTSRYAELNASFDTLQNILSGVEQRDKGVYRMIFEAEPYAEHLDIQQSALHNELQNISNVELGKRFDESLSKFSQRVWAQNHRMDAQRGYISSNIDLANRIPSIQPVDNKDLTLLTASFGKRIHPFYKSMHQHNGVDYSVPVGTAIFATADGTIERIETNGQSSGLTVTINHGYGYKTTYGHLDKVLVPPGKAVMRGDVIAFSGNSGLSYAPHLHYGIQYRGNSVDPLSFFFAELNVTKSAKMKQIASVAMQSFD